MNEGKKDVKKVRKKERKERKKKVCDLGTRKHLRYSKHYTLQDNGQITM